mgnify:CR=1 FL=1
MKVFFQLGKNAGHHSFVILPAVFHMSRRSRAREVVLQVLYEDDVVVGGKYNAWHVIDSRDRTEESHYYGVMFLDSAWLINIAIYQGDPWSLTPEEGEEVIASLLASFKTDLD